MDRDYQSYHCRLMSRHLHSRACFEAPEIVNVTSFALPIRYPSGGHKVYRD